MTATLPAQAENGAGAASHDPVDWHASEWRRVKQTVRRLQARIVKATQAGRWGKVKALQHRLTHSFSGKALAVRRVTVKRILDRRDVYTGQYRYADVKAAGVHQQILPQALVAPQKRGRVGQPAA